jgi:CMP-N-acetylneuraminic acid synthetase
VSEQVNAFIPLKGHSERVPNKNLRPFHGAPLFHTIVSTLNDAERVGRIIIDTDDDEIVESAEALDNVVVVRRRGDLIGDAVPVNDLIGSYLERSEDEHLLQTHSTNPVLTAATIDRAIDTYFSTPGITSLFSVTRMQARFYDWEHQPVNHKPNELIPTQELPPMYLENSNLYVFSREGFFERRTRITENSMLFEMDALEAVDIDEEVDFELAEAVYRLRHT